jgi:ubiquinone/menaquinone biosynthesis C-methylase UbiE/DNA-binding transcriptional ArsR family regulator
MEAWIDRFRALAEETRVTLLAALLDEELSVGELSDVVQAAQPGVSRHLQALREAALVSSRKEGTTTFYRLVPDDPLLDGPFGSELRRIRTDRAFSSRVDKALSRRRQKARDFFDQAEDWDTLRGELFSDAAGMGALLPLVPTALRVADIGTGTGGMLPFLAEIASEIVAIDLSKEMLRRARERAKALGLSNVKFLEGDLAELPLEDGSVDAAFAVLVLHHATHPLAALKEMARVVAPGGVVVVVDLVAHGQEWLRDEQADVWLGFAKDEMTSLLGKAHLEDVRVRVVSRAPVRRGNAQALELFVASGRVKASSVRRELS